MKKIYKYIVPLLAGLMGCQGPEDIKPVVPPVSVSSAEISASGLVEGESSDGALPLMTKALIGSETVASLEGNFIQINEPNQSITEEADYVRTLPENMPSFYEAKIVEGEIISSPDNSAARLRSIVFRPKLTYDYYSKTDATLNPDVAYISRMVGWYPSTYDVPPGVDGKYSHAWFKDSGCMVELEDGKLGVRFDGKLDGQTDLMMTDLREGRMYKSGFKHQGSSNDHDVQPYGHAYVDPLNISEYKYINYFTFHHYLTAVKIYIQAEEDGKGVIGMVNNVKFMNQPTSVTIALPESQSRGGGTGALIRDMTPTLPIEGVQPVFGEIVPDSWADFKDFNIIRTPMMADPSDLVESELPVLIPSSGILPETYLGYALLRPWGGEGDDYETKLQLYTDAGIYPVTLPNELTTAVGDLPAGTDLFQPGKVYKITITIKSTGGLEVVISNEDDEKYRDLSPYNENYGSYTYSNCYLITEDMLNIGDTEGQYAGFFFRATVVGRGPKGDIVNDPYEEDYKLEPHSVSILWQDTSYPIEHVELVQGAVRFKLSDGFRPGNAVIAAHDESGEIIWSWHIWLCNDVVTSISNIMDRNLGAIASFCTDQTNVLDTYGLYYQWGRKDPSPGPMSWNYNIYDMRTTPYLTIDGTRNDVGEVYMSGEAPTIEDGVRNPSVILAPSNLPSDYLYDWLWTSDDDLWGVVSEKKTIYDPCPYGYKVPTNEIRDFIDVTPTSGSFGITKDNLFFPSAGWKGDDVNSATRTHAWMAVGKAGDYQNSSYDPTTLNRGRTCFVTQEFEILSTKKPYNVGLQPADYTSRTIAAPVRCVKYDGEGEEP